ncbi:Uu.00g024440.m01.CDS01 [Anthostomella pinea]|uniref:Uu.00g024440.m01.CDS01 n=1 Tax=Anthostomella pinea TaxID=933095 RepID=A0AAI8W161_9PEZI|nr:Uu.00g024440.m01.CDS01 [Anthostomella pinea]
MDLIPESLAGKPVLVVLSTTLDDAPSGRGSIEELYAALQLNVMRHRQLRVYPSLAEMRQDRYKIGDIRALDIIAQESPGEFAFRPKTCFGCSPCELGIDVDGQNVVKRSHSCGGNGVRTCPKSEAQKEVGCQRSKRQKTGTSAPIKPLGIGPNNPLLLHQEYIPTFEELGEFRVFLCAPDDPQEDAEVIVAAFTKFGNDGMMMAREIRTSDFVWAGQDKKARSAKETQLHRFAQHVYSQLCKRHDAHERYESLKIGVRLDIGVSELSPNGLFFVNEVTRWHSADFFSRDVLSYPCLRICEKYGVSFATYIAKLWCQARD